MNSTIKNMNSARQKFRYVLFDLDGTLSESAPGITHAVQYALKQMGIDEPDLKKLEVFIGPPLNVSFMKYCHFNEEETKKAVGLFREQYDTKGIFDCRPYPGLEHLLQALKENGVHCAVCSSKPEPSVCEIIRHFGFSWAFDVILGSRPEQELNNEMNSSSKKELVDAVLTRLKVPQDQRNRTFCAMVGDKSYDITGAKGNSIEAIGVTYGYGSREELEEAGADDIVHSVEELEALLL